MNQKRPLRPCGHQRPWSDLYSKNTVKLRSDTDPPAQWKTRKMLGFAFPSTCQGSNMKMMPVQSPLDFSCIPEICTHTCTHELCVTANALPGSGWGLGGGCTRPWEPRDTGGKMSRARQRCGELRVETEAKTNPAGPQGAIGPQGQSHQLHLGLWVLLDHCFFHGYQVLAFELMDYITGWCIVL